MMMIKIDAYQIEYGDWVNLSPEEVKQYMEDYHVFWAHEDPYHMVLVKKGQV